MEAMFKYQYPNGLESVKYTNSSSASQGEIIYVAGIGAMVAHDDYDANAEGVYYIRGIVKVSLASGESVSQGEAVVWDTSTNSARVCDSSSLTVGDLYLGVAYADGTASGGYVEVLLNEQKPGFGPTWKTITGTTATITTIDPAIVIDATSNAVTVTLPDAATAADLGYECAIICSNANNTVTISRAGSDTVMGAASITLDVRESVVLVPVGTDWIAKANAYNVASAAIGADSITSAKIADDAVSLEHLDSGIAPVEFIKYTGTYDMSSAATTAQAITVTGASTSTDHAWAVLEGSTNLSAVSRCNVSDANEVTVQLTADPGSSSTLRYWVGRTAS